MNMSVWTDTLTKLNLRSCLISRRGELLLQHYREPGFSGEIARINSCTKSILSALICIALEQRLLPPPSTPIAEFFPQLRRDEDSRKQEITLEHLLTMSSGFAWTEFGGANSFPKMTRSGDWVDYVLRQPLREQPGTRMEYNSGASQLLSAILVQAAGISVAKYAEAHLFGPLGILDYTWQTDPQDIHTGGFGLAMLPADLLKFGELYLRQGRFAGKPLISAELVARSTAAAIPAEPPRRGHYGWHWWQDSYEAETAGGGANRLDYYYARGYGGQFVYILPQLETVVVLTADQRLAKHSPPVDVFRAHIAPQLAQLG